MKKIGLLIAALVVMVSLSACTGTSPAVNANSNKTRVLSITLLDVKSETYTNSFNGNSGTTTNMKD